MMNNTHMALSNRNEMITTRDLHYCLVQQWESLRTCCSAFPITTNWCFDQDLKMVPAFQVQPSQKECAIGAVHCKNEGMLLEPLSWRCIESVVFICSIHEIDQK